MSFALHGVGVSGGIAIGHAYLASHAALEVAHHKVPPDQVSNEISGLTLLSQQFVKNLKRYMPLLSADPQPPSMGHFSICIG